jgi:hypothetical protein
MSAKQEGLSGYIPVRDGLSLDYCFREAAMSLLPIVDELILCDSDSTDGTRKEMDEWAAVNSKIRVVNYPWPRLPTPEEVERDDLTRPPGNPVMLIAWLNFARQHCNYRFQITLDADEVLDPRSYPEIKRAMQDGLPRWMSRVNCWGDPFHEAPHGSVCGERVVRFAPTALEMCSDEPRPDGEPEIRKQAIDGPNCRIWHLGFLRRQEAFLRKSRVMQGALHNCYDPRLRQAEQTGESWVKLSPFPPGWGMLECPGQEMPEYAKAWCRARGYTGL